MVSVADWSRYLEGVPVEHREEVLRLLEESEEAVEAREEVERAERRIWGLMNGRRTRPRSG